MTRTQVIIFVIAILLLSAALAACAGFDLGDMVRVKTPTAIQQTVGLPAQVSLNDAEAEYQGWLSNVQRTGAQWKANIDKANAIRATFNQLTLAALDEVGPTLAGVPMLGPLLPAATGILGLFLGTSRLRKEKENSYNAGLEKGQELGTNGGGTSGGEG
ncbi:MAG: hypothetical protein IT442_17975 [Phycisphaeraceae bacterium]|nr:hypothetical protein [Phycisphaeraceae bacterium]